MSDVQANRKSGGPTPKMLEAATAAAARHSVDLPAGYETNFDICKGFLDVYLSKPSPKALAFATNIAQDKGLTIPDDALANAKALSAWIDANK